MDEIRLGSYSTALMEAFPDDVDTVAVLERLGNSVREEFEPIIPPKAELILMVKREDWARKRKAREEREAAAEKAYAAMVEAERAEEALQGPREKSELEKKLDELISASESPRTKEPS